MQVSDDIIAKFIANNIKSPLADQIANVIVTNSTSDVIGCILNLLLTQEPLTLFNQHDYFKVKIKASHKNKHYYLDNLIDLGLYQDGYVFGQVIKSNDWNDGHNPYIINVKCDLFYGNEKPYEDTYNIFELCKIDKSSIPYFNGTHINTIVDGTPEGVPDTNEINIPE